MVSRLEYRIRNRVFKQMFINLTKCLLKKRTALTSTEIKTIVHGLIHVAIDAGWVSEDMIAAVDSGMDETFAARTVSLSPDDAIKADIVASILSDRNALADELREENDIKAILRLSLAEIEYNRAKKEFLHVIETPAQNSVAEFFKLFEDDLKAIISL